MGGRFLFLGILLVSGVALAGCLGFDFFPRYSPPPEENYTYGPPPEVIATVGLPGAPTSPPLVTPFPTPTPLVIPTPPRGACSGPDGCIGKPFYCSGGAVVEKCTECGCPAETRCAIINPLEGYRCFPNYFPAENFTRATPIPTEAQCRLDNVSCVPNVTECCNVTSLCQWNASRVGYYCWYPPAPSPRPAAIPSAYDSVRMRDRVADAYYRTFGTNLTWTTQENERVWTWVVRSGFYDVDLTLTKGLYRGFGSNDRIFNITAPNSQWFQLAGVDEGSPSDSPYLYGLRMGCFNFTYRVDARIAEPQALGKPKYYGGNFTTNLSDVCPP
jgi:hypothetical protein